MEIINKKPNMKIYISGKITGYEISEAALKFKKTENYLIVKGFDPINPFKLNETYPEKTWEEYMVLCVKYLFECEAIYMQIDWGQSKGARVEHAIARELGLIIYYEGVD
jgi:hypothetical protein